MLDTYRMIVLNLTALVTVSILIFLFFSFFPKKKPNYLLLLIFFSILPIISIFRTGTYESSDLSIHTYGTASFYHALIEGSFIPRWAGDLVYGYGTPHHQIMYFLPRLIPSILHILGLSFLTSLKVFLAGAFIFSGVGMYFWIKEEFGAKAGFVAAIFYLYAPYHLVDLHFRAATGEVLAFTFLPTAFLFTKKLVETGKIRYVLLLSLNIAALILSHQAISLSSFPFLIGYALLLFYLQKKKPWRNLTFVALALIFGVLTTTFHWLPMIWEAKYTWFSTMKGVSFTTLQELLFSPYRYGFLFQGPRGELSFLIGYAQLIVIGTCIALLFKRKLPRIERNKTLFFIISLGILIFMLLPLSEPLWNVLPLIKNFQSTYRLLVPVALFTAYLSAVIVKRYPNKVVVIGLVFLAVFTTILNWGNRRTIPEIKDDSYFITGTKSYLSENNGIDFGMPIWVDPKKVPLTTPPKAPLQIIKGKGEIKVIARSNTRHHYIVSLDERSILKENTFYFPGWKLFVDAKPEKIDFSNPAYPGVIHFTLERGLHDILLTFENTPTRTISGIVSLSSLLLLFLFTISSLFFKKTKLFRRFPQF